MCVTAQRKLLAEALAQAPGIEKIWPSDANFLTFKVADAKATYQGLAALGVIVRDVSHYPGLARSLRVSIGTAAENQSFLRALTQVLNSNTGLK